MITFIHKIISNALLLYCLFARITSHLKLTYQDCVSQKLCKPKLIVETIGGNCSTINLSLRCFWETQT